MLTPKQWNYVNIGLYDCAKGIYYLHLTEENFVYIDTYKCNTTPQYCIKFKNREKAREFIENYIVYNKSQFEVSICRSEVTITPQMPNVNLRIDCLDNEEMAKKLVKMLRKQYIKQLSDDKKDERNSKKDFKGIEF